MVSRVQAQARRKAARRAEAVALGVLILERGRWLGAKEITARVSLPWRCIAVALKRLADSKQVESRVGWTKGSHRSKEYRMEYCYAKGALYPVASWSVLLGVDLAGAA